MLGLEDTHNGCGCLQDNSVGYTNSKLKFFHLLTDLFFLYSKTEYYFTNTLRDEIKL